MRVLLGSAAVALLLLCGACGPGGSGPTGSTGGGFPFPLVRGQGGGANGGGTGGSLGSGGGLASGGGSTTGGGTATGGGESGLGGGAAAGGGGGTAMACTDLTIPNSANLIAFYTNGTSGDATFITRSWFDSRGRNALVVELDWSRGPLVFPVVGTVQSGLTEAGLIMFFWQSCSSDLKTCQKQYLVYDGSITALSATRAPQGSISGTSTATTLQEVSGSTFVFPGSCFKAPALDWAATYSCRADGASCSAASNCCTNVCQAGVCGTPPPCKTDGASCSDSAQCCTSSCSGGVCGGPTCKADGASCSSSSQCCTSSCNTGVCGGPTCKGDGASCSGSSECCTSSCSGGICGGPVCKSDGASCTSSSQCCISTCNSGICGGSTCKDDGYACASTAQCCSSPCSGGICGGGADSCDPVANTGCSAPNECIVLSSEATTCVLTGTRTEGQSCSATTTCAGGYGCFANTCRKICRRSTGAGCSFSSTCTAVSGWSTYGACN